jgi:uncharacterized integral membrane protein
MKPFKLIIFLVILGIIVFFIGFNLSNVSDISFGFHTFTDVPIFISLFIAFAVGIIVMIPFTFTRRKGKDKVKKNKKETLSEADFEDIEQPPIDEE